MSKAGSSGGWERLVARAGGASANTCRCGGARRRGAWQKRPNEQALRYLEFPPVLRLGLLIFQRCPGCPRNKATYQFSRVHGRYVCFALLLSFAPPRAPLLGHWPCESGRRARVGSGASAEHATWNGAGCLRLSCGTGPKRITAVAGHATERRLQPVACLHSPARLVEAAGDGTYPRVHGVGIWPPVDDGSQQEHPRKLPVAIGCDRDTC